MANSSQELLLKFNADSAPAQRAMTTMAQTGTAQMALLAGAAATAGQKIDNDLIGAVLRINPALVVAKAGALAFAAVITVAMAEASKKLREYTETLSSAGSAGVSTDFFQKFTQSLGPQAEKIKALTDGIKEAKKALARGLDENDIEKKLDTYFEAGALSTTAAAARSAFKSTDNIEVRAKAILAIIDELRAKQLDLVAMDLASSVFGETAASALIARADRAGKSLTDMVNTTADKRIVSAEQIENARQLEERLEAARQKMTDGLKPIMDDVEALGVKIYKGWLDIQDGIADAAVKAGKLYTIIKSIGDILPSVNVGGVVGATADAQIANLNVQIQALEKAGDVSTRLNGLRQQRDQLQGQSNAARGQQQLRDNAVPVIPMPGGPVLLGPSDELQAPNDYFKVLRNRVASGEREKARAAADKKGGGGGGSATDSDLEFYEKYVASIEKASAALKTEIETLGLSTLERERATLSSKAYAEFKAKDIELSDEQKAKIDQLIDAQARLKAALEDTKNAMQAQRDLLQFIGTNASSVMSDLASGGENAAKAMMNLGKRLAEAGFQAALLGQGPLAGILGLKGQNGDVGGILGALGKSFFSGGPVGTVGAVTQVFDVGSRYIPRDMPAYVHQGEMILTRGDADRMRSGRAGAGAGINISQSYDFRGSSLNEGQVVAMLEQSRRQTIATIEEKQLKYGSSYGRGV